MLRVMRALCPFLLVTRVVSLWWSSAVEGLTQEPGPRPPGVVSWPCAHGAPKLGHRELSPTTARRGPRWALRHGTESHYGRSRHLRPKRTI